MTYSDPKVTRSDPTHLPLPPPISPEPDHKFNGLYRLDNDIIDNVTRTRTIQPLPDLNGGLVVVLLDGLRVVVAEDLGYWA